jgi:hypothetical protein
MFRSYWLKIIEDSDINQDIYYQINQDDHQTFRSDTDL